MRHNGKVGYPRGARVPAPLDQVRDIVMGHLGEHAERIVLFGSWARGEQLHSSDVDVAVALRADAPTVLLSTLREALEESDLPWNVDVVDIREASPAVREEIEKEGVLWAA